MSQPTMKKREPENLSPLLDSAFAALEGALGARRAAPVFASVGTVTHVGHGIARVEGLPGVQVDEVIHLPGGLVGVAFDLIGAEVGTVLLGESAHLRAGSEARRSGRVLDVAVGDALLGRVVDALGRPLDGRGPVRTSMRRPVERPAPAVMDRAAVTTPLQTGLMVVDAAVPIGRGQRELILGDRQTGKTAIAVDTILNQRGKDVLCLYCAIGQRTSSVVRVIERLREHDALPYCCVMVATGEDAPGLQVIAPYAATSIAEYFMEQGHDVLVVYDDLTRHARAYRELSLLLRRPPGREAFPGDIFYLHSRLLERATHLSDALGGGSLTALPIIETEAQNLSAYVPTNLISITDGQIYLSPDLFQKGLLPAVDVGRSVSRVGGKAQLASYRAVSGPLRLSYSQFQELETFSRFGTRLDEETRETLERGRRVREVLKQPQYQPVPVAEQIAVLLAVTEGVFDPVPMDAIAAAAEAVRAALREDIPRVARRIGEGAALAPEDRDVLLDAARAAVAERVLRHPPAVAEQEPGSDADA